MIRFSHAPDTPAVQFTFLPRNAVQMFTFYVALRFFGTLPIGKKVVLFAALCLSFFALSLCIHKYLLCSPQPLNLALLLLCNLPNDSQTQSRINAIFKLFTAMVRKKKGWGWLCTIVGPCVDQAGKATGKQWKVPWLQASSSCSHKNMQ